MTLSTTDSRFTYSGDGSTTEFSFPRKFISTSDLKVVLTDEDDGSEAAQTLNTHYTVSGAGLSNGVYASGTVTFSTAPGSDKKVSIYRDPTLTNETDFTGESDPLTALNRKVDLLTMQLQRLNDARSRSLRLSEGFWSTFDPTLPDVDSTEGVVAGMVPILGSGLTSMTWGTPAAGGTVSSAMLDVVTASTTNGAVGELNGVLEVATKADLSALTGGVVDAVIVRDRATAGDNGGGGFRWRSGDQSANVTADPGGGVWVAPDAASTGASGAWQRVYTGDVWAEWFGFTFGGGNGAAAANTTALQRALNFQYGVSIGAGSASVNLITHTIANRVTGAGRGKTVLTLGNTQNTRMFHATSLALMWFRDFTIDMNSANNSGSGAHDGIRFDTCTDPLVERVRVTGAQGTFMGSPVGGGVSAENGSGLVLRDFWADLCLDGYVLASHTDARDYGSRLTACRRSGATIGSGCHRFEHRGVHAVGNSTHEVGAGMQLVSANDCKGYGGYFTSNTLGHGLQYNACLRAEQHGGTYNSNGISGLAVDASSNGLKIYGGDASSNTIRGLEIETDDALVVGFCGTSNADVDISIHRAADVQLMGCEGNVRAWDSGVLASATIAAAGSGYTDGTHTATISGGTFLTAATISVTVTGGAVTAVNSVVNAGSYWTLPSEPVSVTGIPAGSGATFNLAWTGENSATVARLQITGGHRSDTINLVAGACADVRLSQVKATTVTDPSAVVIHAAGCVGVPDSTPNPNIIINGDFIVRQRGATFDSTTTPANSDDTYLLDRWTLLSDGNDIVDVTQNTTAAQLPSDRVTGISLDVETANKKFGIIQFVERRSCAQLFGANATLTFRAKKRSGNATADTLRAAILSWSSTADTVTSDVVSAWGIEGTSPTLVANWTYENTPSNLTLTNSYQTFTITAAIDTASVANVAVFIWCDNGDATVADFIDITDVKLEKGAQPSVSIPRSFEEELALCQRYFEKSFDANTAPAQNAGFGGSAGTSALAAATGVFWHVSFATTKRVGVTPSITFYNPAAANGQARDVTAAADCSGTAATGEGQSGFNINTTAAAGSALGNLLAVNWAANSEL